MTVRPAKKEAAATEQVDERGLLGGGLEGAGRGPGACLARAGGADRPEGQDALVPVAPVDAQGVASHLRELVDADSVRRALGHPASIDKVASHGNRERRPESFD